MLLRLISHTEVPETYAKRSDAWIPARFLKYFEIATDFKYETGPTGRQRFVATAHNERELWNCFRFLLEALDKHGKALDLIRTKPQHYTAGNEDNMKKFCDACVQVVGVTKRCCYLCHRLLDLRGVKHSGSHGEVVPWISPPNLDKDTIRTLLQDIQKQLVLLLDDSHLNLARCVSRD
jgi:hypothetical protein